MRLIALRITGPRTREAYLAERRVPIHKDLYVLDEEDLANAILSALEVVQVGHNRFDAVLISGDENEVDHNMTKARALLGLDAAEPALPGGLSEDDGPAGRRAGRPRVARGWDPFEAVRGLTVEAELPPVVHVRQHALGRGAARCRRRPRRPPWSRCGRACGRGCASR